VQYVVVPPNGIKTSVCAAGKIGSLCAKQL
jgi:hypothetical protein